MLDQLIWRAFERQGYELLHAIEDGDSQGPLRVVTKEGRTAALRCLGHGTVLEKGMVEHFARAMERVQAQEGYLVTPGSFTMPAQRYAKERGVILMGREQFMELASAGALDEHHRQQLQQVQEELQDARTALQLSVQQLEELRRHRNEASWFLGEERAKTAKLDAQLAELQQQILHWQAQAEQWQQEAQAMRKQWEESQWYLGEARASAQYLDEQLRMLRGAYGQLEEQSKQLIQKLQEVEQQRNEAGSSLGESRTTQDTLRQRVEQLEERLQEAQGRLEVMRQTSEALQQRLDAKPADRPVAAAQVAGRRSASKERRKALRKYCPEVLVGLQDAAGTQLFQGIPRDVSRTGFRIVSSKPLNTLPEKLRVRVRLPGLEHPIDATGRLVWKQRDKASREFHGGCKFIGLPLPARKALDQLVASSTEARARIVP